MKKNNACKTHFRYRKFFARIFMVMKITALFLLIAVSGVLANSSYSQNTLFSLRLENATIQQVFDEIQKKSEFIIFYKDSQVDLQHRANVDVVDATVSQILVQTLKGTNLEYKIIDRQIVIFPSETKKPPTILKSESTVEQKKELSGTVKDSKGLPLPGVTVQVKGTTVGTITGRDGKFNISVQNDAKTLLFSFVGMKTQELVIEGKTTFNIVMIEEIVAIEDVVVVGYGSQKKATVTGAISSIQTKDLLQSPQANISNALTGRMPGLLAVQRSGEPGKDQSTLRIRGIGTFSGTQDPLVMVDGIESSNYNNIDPNEIENIAILKDASATAVYGVRGANGVLLITTKRGKIGKPQISYTSSFALNQFTDMKKQMNAYDYAVYYNEALKYDTYVTAGVYTPKYSNEAIAKYKSGEDPIFYPDKEWYSEMLKPVAMQQQHNLNISGGTEKVKYFVSAGYFNQGGLFNHTDLQPDYDAQLRYKRYNFRSNFDFNITKRFSANVNIGTQNELRSGTNSDAMAIMNSIAFANPSLVAGMIDGKMTKLSTSFVMNPLSALLQSGYHREYRNYLSGSVRLNYDLDQITKGLSVHGIVSYQNYNTHDFSFNKTFVQYVAKRLPDNSAVFIPQSIDSPYWQAESVAKNRKTLAEFGFNYERQFGNHNVTGLLLYTQSKRFDPNLAFLVPNAIQGIVGRVTYDYKNRYLVDFNMGYNGTENFAPKKRFGFFPAYSIGWVVSEEPFFEENKYLSFLKLRASYGEVGNDQIGGDRFLYRPTAYGYSGSYYFGEGATSYNAYSTSYEGKIGNPDLTWERAKKLDLGVEVSFWDRKIKIEADYFMEHRDNILSPRYTVPASVGANLPAYNLGKMKNGGVDGDISFNNHYRDFNYRIRATYSYAHNIVQSQDEVYNPYAYLYSTGQIYGQKYGLIAEGFFNSWDEVNDPQRPKSIWSNNRMQPGDVKYKDVNSDGVIDTYDNVPLGYSNFPEISYGLSFEGRYKAFDFSVLFQGSKNVSITYTTSYRGGYSSGDAGTMEYFKNSWSQERYNEGLPIDFPRISQYEVTKHNYQPSTLWIRDASYIRLKNAEIGYTISGSLLERIGLSSARLYINGNNLLTWDKMFPGIDPETPETATNTEPYPLTRTMNIGLNIKF